MRRGNARTGFQPDLRERSMARGEISRRNVIMLMRGRTGDRQPGEEKDAVSFAGITFFFPAEPEGCLSEALNDVPRSLFGPKRPSALASIKASNRPIYYDRMQIRVSGTIASTIFFIDPYILQFRISLARILQLCFGNYYNLIISIIINNNYI